VSGAGGLFDQGEEDGEGLLEGAPSGFFGAIEEAGARRGVAGRPKGAKNRKTEAFERTYYALGNRDPLLVLGELVSADPRALQQLILEDDVRRWEARKAEALDTGREFKEPKPVGGPSLVELLRLRVDAADRLAPYLHGKKPIEVHHTGEALPLLVINAALNQLDQARELERQKALSIGSPLVEGEANEINGLADGEAARLTGDRLTDGESEGGTGA